jgi:hypothetical protein
MLLAGCSDDELTEPMSFRPSQVLAENQAPKQQARRAMQLMVRHLESGAPFPPTLLFDNIHLITYENVTRYQ